MVPFQIAPVGVMLLDPRIMSIHRFGALGGTRTFPHRASGGPCDANVRPSGYLEGLRRHPRVPMGQSRDSTHPEGRVVTLLALVFHELGSTGGRRPVMP